MRRRAFRDAGIFILRTPLLPVSVFQQIDPADGVPPMPDETGGTGDWHAPLDHLEFRTAVALQSPSLRCALARASAAARHDDSLVLPLYRYAGRAALRCAPRGLFAAAGIGRVAERTALQCAGAAGTSVRVELSLDYLTALVSAHLVDHPPAGRGATLDPNPSLLLSGESLTFWECAGAGGSRLVALQLSPRLRRLMARLGTRRVEVSRVRSLLRSAGVPDAEVDARLAELLKSGILVPAFGVPTIASNPVGQFIAQLPTRGPLADLGRRLMSVHARRRMNWGSARSFSLPALERLGRQLPALAGFEHANAMFHVEAQLQPGPLTLGKAIVADVAHAIERLHFAFADLHAGRAEPFVAAFAERFGDATIPLLRALDVEHGVGHILSTRTANARWAQRGRRRAMLRLLHGAIARGDRTVELDEGFWDAIAPGTLPPLPPAFSACCRILAQSEEAADAGQREIVLDAVVGTTGDELWSRHARFSERMRAACCELRRHVSTDPGDGVRAEVSFTPHRGADIMSTPAVERWRIECSAGASASDRFVLPLAELFVQARDGRVRLVSERTPHGVLPVIRSAVDPAAMHSPAFRFLAMVASQRWATPLAWEWGDLSESDFLPRVRMGTVVLCPARWRIDGAGLRDAPRPPWSADARGQWARWRQERGLPRWVSLCAGEDRIGSDLTREVGMRLLLKEVSRGGVAILEELRADAAELCVSDGTRRYAHELIVPFVRDQPAVRRSSSASRRPVAPALWAAKFTRAGVKLPGSEWVYVKLYASPRRMQAMLRSDIRLLLARLREQCQIKDWFFFRYADPDWHLRLRVLCPSGARHERVRQLIDAAARSLERKGTIWRAQYDTYFREIERFGGVQVCRWVERLFCVESELALVALRSWPDDQRGSAAKMSLALGWTCWAWRRLGLTHPEVAQLSRGLRRAMVEQRHLDRAQTRAIRPGRIEPALVTADPWRVHALRARPALDRVRASAEAGTLNVTLPELAGDLTHLFVNRLFTTRHVESEYELYAALERHAHAAGSSSAGRGDG